MQCFKQCLESKVIVLSLKRMRGSCFCSHGRPNTTGYWPNLVMNNSRTLRCAPKAIATHIVCVIAPEETVLPSATVRSCGCCNGENFNPCSCANKESMNDAVAPQSTIAKVLNEVFLLAIVQGNMMWSHSLLPTSVLADIDNPSWGLWERLCSKTVCFPTMTECCLTTIIPLSSCGYQPHGAWPVVCWHLYGLWQCDPVGHSICTGLAYSDALSSAIRGFRIYALLAAQSSFSW